MKNLILVGLATLGITFSANAQWSSASASVVSATNTVILTNPAVIQSIVLTVGANDTNVIVDFYDCAYSSNKYTRVGWTNAVVPTLWTNTVIFTNTTGILVTNIDIGYNWTTNSVAAAGATNYASIFQVGSSPNNTATYYPNLITTRGLNIIGNTSTNAVVTVYYRTWKTP